MTQASSKRALVIGSLTVGMVTVLLLTGWLLGQRTIPVWRERVIMQALADSRGPVFWWPASWQSEYQRRKTSPRVDLFQWVYEADTGRIIFGASPPDTPAGAYRAEGAPPGATTRDIFPKPPKR
jgi:hypothetical protein